MNGESAHRCKQWWQRDELEADMPIAADLPMPDPWVDFVGTQAALLSLEQRLFLIGDIDQPVVPRLRTIDVDVDPDGEDHGPCGHHLHAEKVVESSPLDRFPGSAGKPTGNATGKRPGDKKSTNPYGDQS